MGKRSFPLSKVYGLLEPGPVVLVTTSHKGRANVMSMSWHTMLEFVPPLVGCVVNQGDFSFAALKSTLGVPATGGEMNWVVGKPLSTTVSLWLSCCRTRTAALRHLSSSLLESRPPIRLQAAFARRPVQAAAPRPTAHVRKDLLDHGRLQDGRMAAMILSSPPQFELRAKRSRRPD